MTVPPTPYKPLKIPRVQTQAVSVYVPHEGGCDYATKGNTKKCRCVKYLSIIDGGKRIKRSAKTRSWAKADERAQQIRDRWEEAKDRENAIRERPKKSVMEKRTTIGAGLAAWYSSLDNGERKEPTLFKYRSLMKLILGLAEGDGLLYLDEIVPEGLERWVASWRSKATAEDRRIAHSTASIKLAHLKVWLAYCERLDWIALNPARRIPPIRSRAVERNRILPLLGGRYALVIAATYAMDEAYRSDDRFGEELRAIIGIMRWTGLRLGDTVSLHKKKLDGNRIGPIQMEKTGQPHTVVVPGPLAPALSVLPARDSNHPDYSFSSRRSTYKSLVSNWQKKFDRFNGFLSMEDYEGRPLRLKSHQLRDTFAVEHLLTGTSMETLARMLGHASILTTEKYYAPWVPQRQEKLEREMAERLVRMGATVSR